MDNEVSTSVMGTVHLVVVAVIAAILVVFSVMSQDFGRRSVNDIAQSQEASYSQELRDVAGYGAVPVPTLYALLLKSASAAIVADVVVYGVSVRETEDLADPRLLGKKVRIELTPEADRFEVEIKEA
ncbi:hypothetical protein [Cohnella sp. GCM10027633]|uniref:hypothetical protein n=1 Tax=unclassified Cohnella TaxID=2636738 RepID=UPI003635D0B3